jgi:hypothetical protein
LAEINTGAGNDVVKGTGRTGIVNFGRIETGGGSDTITGISNDYGIGIANYGVIDTGGGNDIVDASRGNFDGSGIVSLGKGRDTLMGFGAGESEFFGGSGSDKLLLKEGTYDISGPTIALSGSTGVMSVYQFEQIGGVNGGLFAFKDGTLTVNAAGVGTFA